MNPDLVFYTTYQCPRCHFALEADSEGPPAWVRCAHCGRASLPPEIIRRAPGAGVLEQAHAIDPDDSAAIPGEPGLPRPRSMAALPPPGPARTSTLRLILGSAFFLSILFFVFSVLAGEVVRAMILGVAAAALLFFLSRPERTSSMD